jgi:hypothetical protein
MHRRAKTHRDNFRGLTIYIAGVIRNFFSLQNLKKWWGVVPAHNFLYSSDPNEPYSCNLSGGNPQL